MPGSCSGIFVCAINNCNRKVITRNNKMNINDVFKKYDPKSECVWKEYKEMKFFIAPMGNVFQKKRITELFTLKEALGLELSGALAFENVKAKEAMGNVYNLYSQSLVFDWQNVQENDKDVAFNPAKIYEWMMEHDEFANWLIESAQEVRKEQFTKKEEVIKN